MRLIERHAQALWSALYFYRRATNRDRTPAIKIIHKLTRSPIARIARTARTTMKEIQNERSCKD